MRRPKQPWIRFALVSLLFLSARACESPKRSTGTPLEVSLQPDLVLGGQDLGPFAFSDIRAITVDAIGRIYVADVREREIRVFDSTGAVIRTIGRPGRGPGEFVHPVGLDVDSDGNLFVYDPMQRRVSEFDTAGRPLRTLTIPIHSYGPWWEGGIDNRGRLVDRQAVYPDGATPVWTIRFLDLKDWRDVREPFPDCGIAEEPSFQFERGFFPVPFGAGLRTWVDLNRKGTWCIHTGRAAAYFVPFGQRMPVDSVVTHATPRPVTESDRQSALANLGRQVPAEVLARFDLERHMPPTMPVTRGVTTDEAGRVYLYLFDVDGPALHVFSSDGALRARLRLSVEPERGRYFVARRGFVYVVARDSVDTPYVVRFRVPLTSW